MNKLAPLLIGLSIMAGIGLSASPDVVPKIGSMVEDTDSSQNYRVVHEHALFHIVVNGTEEDLSAEQFQLKAKKVHLENNMSDVVHKHRSGVSWQDFMESINVSVAEGKASDICLRIYEKERCGEGKVILNGEKADLDTEISQGDNFLIILDTTDMDSEIESYMKLQLPNIFKPEASRGRRL